MKIDLEPAPLPLASIGRRLGAMILDGVIVGVLSMILGHAIPVIGSLLVMAAYAPVLESSEVRATIGKHLMGIQVADLSGGRISFRTGLIRYVMKFVSSVLLFAGYFVAFFTEKKQTLHDLVAETVVVYGRSERPLVDAWLDQLKAIFRSDGGKGDVARNLAELERLQALRERGALTEEEFQAQKRKLMGE